MSLYEGIHHRFERFCRFRVFDEEQAKDLVSETILAAYENFHMLREEKAFLYFLFGIANRILSKQRRRMKFRGIFNMNEVEQIEDETVDPETMLDIKMLYEALKKLPIIYRDAVILHEISGFSLKDVAGIQGCTISAIKVRVMRARNKLSQLLVDRDPSYTKEKTVNYFLAF